MTTTRDRREKKKKKKKAKENASSVFSLVVVRSKAYLFLLEGQRGSRASTSGAARKRSMSRTLLSKRESDREEGRAAGERHGKKQST
jgi:hypothetical protein